MERLMVKVFPVGTRERFVDLVCSGLSVQKAAGRVGVSRATGGNWWRQSGAMSIVMGRRGGLPGPVPAGDDPPGRALTLAERAMIQMGRRTGLSYAAIGRALGRDRSVVWREVQRHASPDGVYYASVAHRQAMKARARPKPFKLAENPGLCAQIGAWMDQGWSPKIIARALKEGHGGDQTWAVSHETIYQALYVQTRGGLRADLARKLSLKRRHRVTATTRRASPSPYKEAFTISDRPAEVADRAVPGHWEGDLIIGSSGSAIGTLVERSTRFVILLHLPGRHTATEVADAMIREMRDLPEHLRRSITWDRGTELAEYRRIQLDLNAPVYFCDPHSPWQRGSNENTNRLLRFWFEKGTNLKHHTAQDLRHIAATLNQRPRPTLNFDTPATRLNQLLNTTQPPHVAHTT
jgi:IS30 family transposase